MAQTTYTEDGVNTRRYLLDVDKLPGGVLPIGTYVLPETSLPKGAKITVRRMYSRGLTSAGAATLQWVVADESTDLELRAATAITSLDGQTNDLDSVTAIATPVDAQAFMAVVVAVADITAGKIQFVVEYEQVPQ